MNPYVEIKNAFQFLECAVRQNETISRCNFPYSLKGRRADSVFRDYVTCLMLVSVVAQLEHDIDELSGVPGLHHSNKLANRLRVLKDHFHIDSDAYDGVDRIREARNLFVHDGDLNVSTGCTRSEMPGIIVTFLQRCKHPLYP